MRTLVGIALVLAACGTPVATPGPASPSATAAALSASPAATPSGSPSPSPTLRPNPSAGPGTYTSLALGYRVDLPAGWRRSDCASTPALTQPPGTETFTPARVDEEGGSDIGPHQEVVDVHVESSATAPRQWFERLGGSVTQRIESAKLDGTDVLRIVDTRTGAALAYALTSGGRLYALTRSYALHRDGNADTAAAALIDSFHVLTASEAAAVRGSTATLSPPPARTPEDVAQTIAKGFAQQDTTVLASVASPCLTHAREQAGADWGPTQKRLTDLRQAFARGLLVTAHTTLQDRTADVAFVAGTWNDPNDRDRQEKNVRHMIQRIGATWYWTGWIDLMPR